MNYQNLVSAFTQINDEIHLPEYLQIICNAIANGKINKENIDEILLRYQVSRSVATVDFLHVIFAYIKIALEDEKLTDDEKNNINFLKTLFFDAINTLSCTFTVI